MHAWYEHFLSSQNRSRSFARNGQDARTTLGSTFRTANWACRGTAIGRSWAAKTMNNPPAALPVRSIYAVHNRLPLYRLKEWRAYIDCLAEDAVNDLHFFIPGFFRSRLFPEANPYAGRNLGFSQPKLSTNGVRQLIRYAHDKGIAFNPCLGVFGWDGIQEIVTTRFPHLQGKGMEAGWMCVAKPESRRIMRDYILELADTFPEADGLSLEIGCEGGHCQCARCSARAGDYELDFLEDLGRRLWKTHPHMRIHWFIGYKSHREDPAYYERIRRFEDNRLVFMCARLRNHFVDRSGRQQNFNSKRVFRRLARNRMPIGTVKGFFPWTLTIDQVRGACRFARDTGSRGCVMSYGDAQLLILPEGDPHAYAWYGLRPFQCDPLEWLPLRVARFVWREFSLDPDLSDRALRQRLRRKFFDERAPMCLVDDLLWLCDFNRQQHWVFAISAYKDALWARTRGTWHFYYGHAASAEKFGSPVRPPRRPAYCTHPAEMLDEWEAAGEIPQAWLAFFYRLEKTRRILPHLNRVKARARARLGDGSREAARGTREMLRVIGVLERNVLFVPAPALQGKAARLDDWVKRELAGRHDTERLLNEAPYAWGSDGLWQE